MTEVSATYIQGMKIIELHKKGWRSVIEPVEVEDSSMIPIGGPSKVRDPDGKYFWVLPDGTLKEVMDARFDVV